MARTKQALKARAKNRNGGPLGFEAKLWAAADKLRGNMDAAEYKHVVLGLIFLKYISDAFEEQHASARRPSRTAPIRKTRTSTGPRTSSGCPRRRAGTTLQAKAKQPDDRQAASTTRWSRSSATTRRSRACCPRTTRGPALDKHAARRADRPDRHDRPGRRRRTARKTSSAASTSTSSASSPAPRARSGGEFYTPRSRRPAAGRDDRAVQGPRLRPLLRLGRHVRAEREVRRGPRRPHRRHRRSTARSRTPRPGASPR